MKKFLIMCMTTLLLLNTAASFAAQLTNKTGKESTNETCKRPPAPPKDKNGHPLPPPKDKNGNQPTKDQPPHDSQHGCPPPSEKKHEVRAI
ncbi:hypothetical protein [Yersinia aleksiciae]|uniref:hypothetical protein n=1 Tax=Yersinia aleksiciae TaxID=263819 RepID=UPI00119D5BAA|nr:hypothetical protein [Yersinia aleksiciae]